MNQFSQLLKSVQKEIRNKTRNSWQSFLSQISNQHKQNESPKFEQPTYHVEVTAKLKQLWNQAPHPVSVSPAFGNPTIQAGKRRIEQGKSNQPKKNVEQIFKVEVKGQQVQQDISKKVVQPIQPSQFPPHNVVDQKFPPNQSPINEHSNYLNIPVSDIKLSPRGQNSLKQSYKAIVFPQSKEKQLIQQKTQLPLISACKKPPLPPKLLTDEFLKQLNMKEDSDKLFQQYVQQQRLARIKREVNMIKKKHIITNADYEASDEEDPEKNQNTQTLKQKSEGSHDKKVFQPKIIVSEASEEKLIFSNLRRRPEDEWPYTDPKNPKKKHVHKPTLGSPILSRGPMAKVGSASLAPQYADRIARLRQAKRKKFQISRKLQAINKQMYHLKSVSLIRSPKFNSDDKTIRLKALSLVHRMKVEKKKREETVNNIFRRVDTEISERIEDMTTKRAEREMREREKRKIQALERMREHERKKLEEYRLQAHNVGFLKALKDYEIKKYGSKPRLHPSPNLNDNNMQKRNFSWKGSILEDYNRDLLKKY